MPTKYERPKSALTNKRRSQDYKEQSQCGNLTAAETDQDSYEISFLDLELDSASETSVKKSKAECVFTINGEKQ